MINDKKVLAVIIARAGSLGVKNKNFREINGLPLVNYSVISAQESVHVDNIIISSNCPHVKEATQNLVAGHGSTYFVDRPDELATPLSKNESALTHAYYYSKFNMGVDAEIIINLQPTSPYRRMGLIDDCLQKLEDDKADSLLTVSKSTPFFWRFRENKLEALYDYKNRPMREEVDKAGSNFYFDNGNVYISRRHILLDGLCRLGSNPTIFEINKFESYQIDDEMDFKIIESILERISGSS